MNHAIFTASQFTPTQWDSAEQKAKFANQFVRFVESDFKATLFPKWFYTRLSMTFGHIAHFNQGGFYATFFESTQGKVDFLEITAGETGLYGRDSLGICGDPTYTYSDVEHRLRRWVNEQGLVGIYSTRLRTEIETHERNLLATLKTKYPETTDYSYHPLLASE